MKVSLALDSINRYIKIKVAMVIDEGGFNGRKIKTVDKFTYRGSEFLSLSPHAYVAIDFASAAERDGSYNPNRSFSLNKRDLYRFCNSLKRMISLFTAQRDLFYMMRGELKVDMEIAMKNRENLLLSNQKLIVMQHCVVHDEENQERTYEGIFITINGYDNFAYVTYDELKYMFDLLSRVDLSYYGVLLLNAYYATEKMTPERHATPPVTEKRVEEHPQSASIPYVKLETPSTIPDLQNNKEVDF